MYIDSSYVQNIDNNGGYKERLEASLNGGEVSCIIPLNRYSFFKSLETNQLAPSQIQISATLTDDNVLIYKTNGSEPGRVVVTKFILWIPRLLFNSSGLGYVMKNYMIPTSWTYLRKMVQTLNNIKHVDNNFRISPSISKICICIFKEK